MHLVVIIKLLGTIRIIVGPKELVTYYHRRQSVVPVGENFRRLSFRKNYSIDLEKNNS